MKNKKVIIILTSMIALIGGILFTNHIYNKSKNKHIPKRNNLAIMVKGESGEYESSDAIPKGNYVLNEDKTICENGGKVVSYNNSTGQIGFSFLGSDRCSLYFDKIIDTEKPVISNLTINDTTVIATLTDNIELSGYGISTSNTVEPTSWDSISGTSYNLSTTITTEGTYYLWVKDSSDNKTVSDAIDLVKYSWKTILANNTLNETTPDFSKIATTNEGMYATEDDLGTSYYFRGAVNNNWVKFGKDSSGNYMYWRIIRINGDGSIRMIYSGTSAPTSSTATVMTGIGTQINATTYQFYSISDKSEYVGYQYINGEQHGYGECNGTSASCTVNGTTVYNSAIKQAIDKWYAGTTLEKDATTKALVSQDQIFCNDRSASSTQTAAWTSTGASYSYGAHGRLDSNKTPILTCPTASDKFTVNTSNGNGALTYPVGLITADEVAMAGGVYGYSNSSYYLYTNQSYWSGSPGYFYSSSSFVTNLFVNSSGSLSLNAFFIASGIRPVISLSSSVKLSGDGTYNNVYMVS